MLLATLLYWEERALTRSGSAAGRKPPRARRRLEAAVGRLLVLLTLPLWLTALHAQEPDKEESLRIMARAEQQLDRAPGAIGAIEADLNDQLIARENAVIPLVQKAAAIASQARALADRLGHSTSALKTAVYNAKYSSRWRDRDEEGLESKRARCRAVKCRPTKADWSAYDPQNPSKSLPMSEDELQKITDIIDSCSAVDFSKSYRQKVLSRLRGAIAKATAAAGTVSGMMEIIDLQSRGLDPQAPLNEAETKLHVANSRLADMAVLAVQRLQRISKNLQRENLELSRVRLPELEPRALQLRRVLAVVRDRSDKLVARLSAKAEERPTLETRISFLAVLERIR